MANGGSGALSSAGVASSAQLSAVVAAVRAREFIPASPQLRSISARSVRSSSARSAVCQKEGGAWPRALAHAAGKGGCGGAGKACERTWERRALGRTVAVDFATLFQDVLTQFDTQPDDFSP